jgi:isoamylase
MDAEIIWPGRPYPLGATSGDEGTNFAVYARQAEQVDLCLFDASDPSRELRRTPLREKTGHVFHAYLPGLRPGTLYGFRAHGPHEPARGLTTD